MCGLPLAGVQGEKVKEVFVLSFDTVFILKSAEMLVVWGWTRWQTKIFMTHL